MPSEQSISELKQFKMLHQDRIQGRLASENLGGPRRLFEVKSNTCSRANKSNAGEANTCRWITHRNLYIDAKLKQITNNALMQVVFD